MQDLEDQIISRNTKVIGDSLKTKTIKYLKFLLLPNYRLQDLTNRRLEYEKFERKRKPLRRLKSKLTVIGISIIIFILTLAVFSYWISPYSYTRSLGGFSGQWEPPSPSHPLGQSDFGLDVLSRVIWGTRSSLIIALGAISISVLFGTIIGLISAYYGKWLDLLLMRIMEIIMSFPGIILALVIIVILRPQGLLPLETTIMNLILIFGIISIPYFSRLIRGLVLQIREQSYIDAARVSGANNSRIMFKHILPNCIFPIIISISFKIGSVIISLAVISFLGFGDPRLIEWGLDISIARPQMEQAPWAALAPSFMILITVLGFMLLGDGLRDAFDIQPQVFDK